MSHGERRFFVIIPVHNRLEPTRYVLSCLQAQQDVALQVYVVDDGSTDGTGPFLEEVERQDSRVHRLVGDGNLWWTGGVHKGIQEVAPLLGAGDVVVLMNNDVHVEADFLANAGGLLARYPQAVLSALAVDAHAKTIGSLGSVMVSWPLALTIQPYYGEPMSVRETMPEVIALDFLGAYGTFFPAEVIRKIGNVNVAKLPHYHADGEFSNRAKRAGFALYVCRDLLLYYDTSTTGSFNSFGKRYRLSEFLRSLTDIRSVNNLRYRWNLAMLCAPWYYAPAYFFSDTLKMLLRSLVMMLGHEQVPKMRRLANRVGASVSGNRQP